VNSELESCNGVASGSDPAGALPGNGVKSSKAADAAPLASASAVKADIRCKRTGMASSSVMGVPCCAGFVSSP
jgi:hypothetical protein